MRFWLQLLLMSRNGLLTCLNEDSYDVRIVEDGDDGHYLTNRETLKVSQKKVAKSDVLKLKLAPGGGACLLFRKK